MFRNLILILVCIPSLSFMVPGQFYKKSKHKITITSNDYYNDYIVKNLKYTVYDQDNINSGEQLLNDINLYICNNTNKQINSIKMNLNEEYNQTDTHSQDLFKISQEQKNIDKQIEIFRDYVKRKNKSNTVYKLNKKYKLYMDDRAKKRALYRETFNRKYNRADEPDN